MQVSFLQVLTKTIRTFFFYVSKLSNQDFALFFQASFNVGFLSIQNLDDMSTLKRLTKKSLMLSALFGDINVENPLTSKTFQNGALG